MASVVTSNQRVEARLRERDEVRLTRPGRRCGGSVTGLRGRSAAACEGSSDILGLNRAPNRGFHVRTPCR